MIMMKCFTFSLSRVWNVKDWEYGLHPNLFWDLHNMIQNCTRRGNKLKLHQEIGILHSWNFQDGVISSIYICIHVQIYICHLMCIGARTFVTSGETFLARVLTLTATFSQPAICGLCFIIHFTKTDSATILLHHSYSMTFPFIGNNSVTFGFIGNNSVTFWYL